MRAALVAALLLSAIRCSVPMSQGVPLKWSYYRCGNEICIAESHTSPLAGLANPMGDGERAVLVPLRGAHRPVRLLTDGWATDGSSVWCGKLSPEGSLESLRPLGSPFYALGSEVRFRCGRTSFRPGSFEMLGCRTVRYQDRIYAQHPVVSDPSDLVGQKIPFEMLTIADPATFRVRIQGCTAYDAIQDYALDYEGGPPYAVKRNQHTGFLGENVWIEHEGKIYWGTPKDGRLVWGTVKDGKVIFEGNEIVDADRMTFMDIDGFGKCSYAFDDRHVYFDGKAIAGADPRTFVVFGPHIGPHECFAYDRNRRYHDGDELRPEDVAVFEAALRKAVADQDAFSHMLRGPGYRSFDPR
jgi:hypothetical protein